MIGAIFGTNRQRRITNRGRGGSTISDTSRSGIQRTTHNCSNCAICCNGCRLLWWMIANVSYVVLYLVLGFITGIILLFLLYLLSKIAPTIQLNSGSSANFDPATSTSITDVLVKQAAQNHKDETNRCVIPLDTTTVTIKPPNSNGNVKSSEFRLVVYSKETDFLSSFIIKKGYWEIRSTDEMAALSPSLTLPKSMMKATTTTGATTTMDNAATTFYDIGANIGYYSFLFAASGYNVIAFEPMNSNHALFRASMCLNTHLSPRIQLYDYIISDISSSTDDENVTKYCKLVGRVNARTRKYLYSIPRLNCDMNYQCRPDEDLVCQKNVTVSSLHHFVNDLHPDVPLPDIIKLDVEGQELNIIQSIFIDSVQQKPLRQQQQQRYRRIEPRIIQYENKDGRVAPTIESILTINGYSIGTKRGHDQNTIAEYQPPKRSKQKSI